MKFMFSSPYDIRMYLATLYSFTFSDGKICHKKGAYWSNLVSLYTLKYGIDYESSYMTILEGGNVNGWVKSLKSSFCSARFLIKEIAELIWCDGKLTVGEYERLIKIAEVCGVSILEVNGFLLGAKAKYEAEALARQIIERGGEGFSQRCKKNIDMMHCKVVDGIKNAKQIMVLKYSLCVASIMAIIFFIGLVILCYKENSSKVEKDHRGSRVKMKENTRSGTDIDDFNGCETRTNEFGETNTCYIEMLAKSRRIR